MQTVSLRLRIACGTRTRPRKQFFEIFQSHATARRAAPFCCSRRSSFGKKRLIAFTHGAGSGERRRRYRVCDQFCNASTLGALVASSGDGGPDIFGGAYTLTDLRSMRVRRSFRTSGAGARWLQPVTTGAPASIRPGNAALVPLPPLRTGRRRAWFVSLISRAAGAGARLTPEFCAAYQPSRW